MHETEMGSTGPTQQPATSASGRLRPADSERLPVYWPPWQPGKGVLEFTDDTFDAAVLQADRPVVVDFWADTCVPCRLQEPTIEAIATELEGKAYVGRVNVYHSPRITSQYQIKGVPHLMVVRDGKVILELIGDHSLPRLKHHLGSVGLFD